MTCWMNFCPVNQWGMRCHLVLGIAVLLDTVVGYVDMVDLVVFMGVCVETMLVLP